MYIKALLDKYHLLEDTFVVFDVETTGLSPRKDKLIEIGAVKICNGKIIDRFNELINPEIAIPIKITSITHITNEMVKNCQSDEVVVKKFLKFVSDCPVVAHNAKFDVSFIKVACFKYRLGPFKNDVIDTMEIARILHPEWMNHKLETLTNNLDVKFDNDKHHRALYDAEGTALAFYKICQEINDQFVR